jgi:hypothetical protein
VQELKVFSSFLGIAAVEESSYLCSGKQKVKKVKK